MLEGIAEGFGDAAWGSVGVKKLGAVGNRPQREQRLHARRPRWRARGVVGHQREIAEAQGLAEAFVICEDKCPVFYDRAASEPPKTLRSKCGMSP